MTTLLGGFLLGACSSGAQAQKPTEPEEVPECAAYVAAYQGCFGRQGGSSLQLANERAATLRASLLPTDDAPRERLRDKCAAATRQLTGACQ